jgi:hypothetical protein
MSATRWARIGFALVAWLFAFGAIVQFYLAGAAIFATGSFELHRNAGYMFGLLAIVLIVLALAGRMPRRVVAASALLFGLMMLQSVFVVLRTSSPNIAALHPVNGLLIVGLGLWLAWRALGNVRAPLPAEPAPVVTPGERAADENAQER